MTVISRLRELLKAASPGPWIQEFEHDYDSGEETTYPIVLAAPGTAAQCARLQIIGGFRDEDDMACADAKLAALAPDLARLVMTLTKALKDTKAEIFGDKACYDDCLEHAEAATKALATVKKLSF